jgi:hypothetical protein
VACDRDRKAMFLSLLKSDSNESRKFLITQKFYASAFSQHTKEEEASGLNFKDKILLFAQKRKYQIIVFADHVYFRITHSIPFTSESKSTPLCGALHIKYGLMQ